MASIEWSGVGRLTSRRYVCGYCGSFLVSQEGYEGRYKSGSSDKFYVYICHYCEKPTYFDNEGKQTPGHPYGGKIENISDKHVEDLYNEARSCMSCGAYSASVMCSRKLLMNIAVSKGAKERLPFVVYVNYLAKNGYVPPDGKEYLSHIKDKGNEANHIIAIKTKEDAEDLIDFLEMVLKFIYAFPARFKKRKEKIEIKVS